MGTKTLITSADGLPGTDGYRPPEYSDRKFSVLSDMYSYGVVRRLYDSDWSSLNFCVGDAGVSH